VLLGSGLVESTLVAQAIAPRTFRAVAGESRIAALSDGVPPMMAITSARTTPPLEFPILVRMTAAPELPVLELVIPPATPAGDYTIEISGRGTDGRSISTALRLTVDAVTVKAAAVAMRPPAILLNGFQLICTDDTSTLTASTGTFGQLATLLQDDGAPVLYFNNCAYGDISIEQLGGQLGAYIAGLRYTDGTPVPQVDLVAHSMGGLIVRAYLSGKSQTSGVFSPPANPMVRKLVTIGTPHFGSFQAAYVGVQESEMALGNQVLWDLATWNQGQEDLRGVDAIAVIGNAGTYGTTNNASDGVVSLTSGSLGFVETDQRTRIVPYCHIPPNLFTNFGIGMSCSIPEGIAYIDSHRSLRTSRLYAGHAASRVSGRPLDGHGVAVRELSTGGFHIQCGWNRAGCRGQSEWNLQRPVGACYERFLRDAVFHGRRTDDPPVSPARSPARLRSSGSLKELPSRSVASLPQSPSMARLRPLLTASCS
jgi:pimeloyl-ACP methyl ester carboxylesterase